MSRDLAREARRWVDQATDDLEAARLLCEHGRHAQACFLAQQTAEKALKAILYARGADVVMGHSVAALCDEVSGVEPEIADRCPEWASLDQYYIPTRYPDALPGGIPAAVFTGEQTTRALALAAEVLDAARRHVAERGSE